MACVTIRPRDIGAGTGRNIEFYVNGLFPDIQGQRHNLYSKVKSHAGQMIRIALSATEFERGLASLILLDSKGPEELACRAGRSEDGQGKNISVRQVQG